MKFPEINGEVGIAIGMSAGKTEVLNDLQASNKVLIESYMICSEEMNARIPARAEAEDLGESPNSVNED